MDNLIRFSCPRCGKTLKAKPEHVGRQGHCSCGEHFRVPGELPEPEFLPTPTPVHESPLERVRTSPKPAPVKKSKRLWITLAAIVLVAGIGGAGYWWFTQPSSANQAIYKDYIRTGNELADMHKAIATRAEAEAARQQLWDKARENMEAWKKMQALSAGKRKSLDDQFKDELNKVQARLFGLVEDYTAQTLSTLVIWGSQNPGMIGFFHSGGSGPFSVFELGPTTATKKTDSTTKEVKKSVEDTSAKIAALAGDWETPAMSLKIDKAGKGTYEWLFNSDTQSTLVVGDLTVQAKDGKLLIAMSPTVFGTKSDYEFLAKLSGDGAELDLQETADRAKPKTLKRKGASATPMPPTPPVAKSKPDPDLQGSWKMVTVYDKLDGPEKSYIVLSSKHFMTIDGNSVKEEYEHEGQMKVANYVLDADQSKNPKTYTKTPVDGKASRNEIGIYAMQADGKLWICNQTDGKIPESFTVKRGDGKNRIIFEYERIKTVEKKPNSEPLKPKSGSLTLADFKGKWVSNAKYDGGMLIIVITISDNGNASYLRTYLKDSKVEGDVFDRSTKITSEGDGFSVKLLEGSYRCELKNDRIEMKLTDGKGPETWSFGRTDQ